MHLLRKVDKSKYPKKLVDMVNNHMSICGLIDDEDWGEEYIEDWEKNLNNLPEEEKKILKQLLSLPDYEEIQDDDEIYGIVEEITVKLRKANFSHKQIVEYIKLRFDVKLNFDDHQWIRKICQCTDRHDVDYEDIAALTEFAIQEVVQKVGFPRGTGSG